MPRFNWQHLKHQVQLYAVIIAILLAVCPWLWQGVRDAYVGYSGKVVAKGNYMWVPFRGPDWYIIVEDAQGHRTKRYVSAYGYPYCDVGTYVVKKQGFSEFPRKPGEPTPSEFEQLARRKQGKQEQQTTVPN